MTFELGAKYDDQGLRRSWWTSLTETEYNERKEKMVGQYGSYRIPAGKIKGQLTIGENIADNGGLKAAYKVHKLKDNFHSFTLCC